MGIARNIARLVPNGSGLLPNANIEAMAATKLTGIVPDANAPSGSVIQVVQTIKTDSFSATGNSGVTPYEVTGLNVTITPSSTNSKILLIAEIFMGMADFYNTNYYWNISRGSTAIGIGTVGTQRFAGGHNMYLLAGTIPFAAGNAKLVLDSPATTSATTYKIFIGAADLNATLYINRRGSTTNDSGVSSITALEIAA